MILISLIVTKGRTSCETKQEAANFKKRDVWLNWIIEDIMSTEETTATMQIVPKQNRPAKVFLSEAGAFDNDIYQDHELELNLYPSFSVLHQL